jgi:hypothetical protein
MNGALVVRTVARWFSGLALSGVLTLSSALAAATTLTGFVTRVDSPTEFHVGSLRVVLDGKTQCETQRLRSEIRLQYRGLLPRRSYYQLLSRPVPGTEAALPCDVLPLRVGSRVRTVGDRGHGGDTISAAALTLYRVDLERKFSTSWKPPRWSGGALLEEQPHVSQMGQGWGGTLWLDGYPMRLMPGTKPLAWPDAGDPELGSLFGWGAPLNKYGLVPSDPPASEFSASLFRTNTWATYRGTRRSGDHVVLDRIGLWPDRPYAGCKEISDEVAPTIRQPDYANRASGSLVFPPYHYIPFDFSTRKRIIRIVPDRNAQGYISRLGASLIPQYQARMPGTNDTKVDFRFYIAQSGADFDAEVINVDSLPWYLFRPGWDDAALALPNGIVLVPARTLARLRTNAQLAAILSSAIGSVLQEQSCIASLESSEHINDGDGIEAALIYEAFEAGFVPWREEQAMRIGIRQMYLAGYDIGEAPSAWAAAIGQPIANPLRFSTRSAGSVPWYTAYAFNYISKFYSNVDYSKLKRGRAEYAQFLKELRQADPEAFQQREK